MKPVVLIVSQETEFYLIFGHILKVDGFPIDLVHKPDQAYLAATKKRPIAVVLDCQVDTKFGPMIDRFKNDASTSSLPIIGVLAPGAQARHIELLTAGADEIFQRPFEPSKLIEFLDKHQPAKPGNAGHSKSLLAFRDVELNLETYRVHAAGTEVELPPIEYKLLQHFMLSPGKVFARGELIEAAWPPNAIADERSVDVHIGRLRKALKRAVGYEMIRTVRTAGYALAE